MIFKGYQIETEQTECGDCFQERSLKIYES